MSRTSSVSRSQVLRRGRSGGLATVGPEGATWVTRSDYEGWKASTQSATLSATHMKQHGAQPQRQLSRRALLASSAGAVCVAWLGRVEPLLAADAGVSSVTALHTAAALENTALQLYDAVLALPVSVAGTANTTLARVLSTTRMQHADHAAAFNAAAQALGGAAQTGVDMAMYSSVIAAPLAALNGPADVLRVTAAVEGLLASTYVSFTGMVADISALSVLCSTAPVEAQHAATLLTLAALLTTGAPELVAIPPATQALPAAVGVAGFPASTLPLQGARAAGEEAR